MEALKGKPGNSRSETHKLLSGFKVFRGLEAKHLDGLAKRAVKRVYARGDVIFSAGEESENVYGILRGRVHVSRNTSRGRRMVVEVLSKGDLFGIRWDWKTNSRYYDTTAVAKEPTVVLAIATSAFQSHCFEVAECAGEMCALFAQKLKAAYDQRSLGQETMQVRLAAALAVLHRRFGEVVPLTKKELSELIDATQETTFRTISRLQRQGHIQSLRGGIRILDRKGLDSLIPN